MSDRGPSQVSSASESEQFAATQAHMEDNYSPATNGAEEDPEEGSIQNMALPQIMMPPMKVTVVPPEDQEDGEEEEEPYSVTVFAHTNRRHPRRDVSFLPGVTTWETSQTGRMHGGMKASNGSQSAFLNGPLGGAKGKKGDEQQPQHLEPKRVLPTASYGGEAVLLPTADVLETAMDKASSRAPPQKANIQESVHLILAKLSGKVSSVGSSFMQKQREANSCFMNKEMEHIIQARRSQRKMKEFQDVLERLEDEAVARRRMRRRVMDGAGGEEVAPTTDAMDSSDDDDEEENSEDFSIPNGKEELEKLRSMQTSNALVMQINDREARRWLDTQKKVIENPDSLKVLQINVQRSADRLRVARLHHKEPRRPAGTTGTTEPGEISWGSLPHEGGGGGPLSTNNSLARFSNAVNFASITNGALTLTAPEEPIPEPPSETLLSHLLQLGNGRSIYGLEKRSMCQKERTQKQVKRKEQNRKRRLQMQQGGSTNLPSQLSRSGEASTATKLGGGGVSGISVGGERGKREVHFVLDSSSVDASAMGEEASSPSIKPLGPSNTTTPTAPQKPPSTKPSRRFGAIKKHTEPLPPVVGVADRSASVIRHEILSMRRKGIHLEVMGGEDVNRTYHCMEELLPLRVALLEADLFESNRLTHPSQWEGKYVPQIVQQRQLQSKAHEREMTPVVQPSAPVVASYGATSPRSTQGTEDGSEVAEPLGKHITTIHAITEDHTVPLSEPVTAEEHSAITMKEYQHGGAALVDPGMMLDKHRRLLFDTALRMDDADRKRACVDYVTCLEALSKERISTATWPSAVSAFARSRHILEYEPHRQNLHGFTALVHEEFLVEQLVQWPVQEMLRRLAGVFFVSQNQYRDWMAGLYQKMSNTHDYEGRFRAVDCTIKNKDIPTEAHVRITLHCCRKLPRFDSQMAAAAVPVEPVMPVKSMAEAMLDSELEIEAQSFSASDSADNASSNKIHQEPSTDTAEPGKTTGTLTVSSPLSNAGLTGESDPLSPPANEAAMALRHEESADDHSEKLVHIPEYAVRLSAERQMITSSAVPAGNTPAGRQEDDSQSDSKPEDNSNTVTARQRVYFYDQTFKLHLYDVSSIISVELLSDGAIVSTGGFNIERYLHWKKSTVWLPLKGKDGSRSKMQLTIEVI